MANFQMVEKFSWCGCQIGDGSYLASPFKMKNIVNLLVKGATINKTFHFGPFNPNSPMIFIIWDSSPSYIELHL